MNLEDRTFLKSLGERVRMVRVERGLTQEQLGERAELHRTFIGSVERGERNIAILSLRRISKALRTSLDELLPSRSKKG